MKTVEATIDQRNLQQQAISLYPNSPSLQAKWVELKMKFHFAPKVGSIHNFAAKQWRWTL